MYQCNDHFLSNRAAGVPDSAQIKTQMNYKQKDRPRNVPSNCAYCGEPLSNWEVLMSDTHARCIKKQQATIKDEIRRRNIEIAKQQMKLS